MSARPGCRVRVATQIVPSLSSPLPLQVPCLCEQPLAMPLVPPEQPLCVWRALPRGREDHL